MEELCPDKFTQIVASPKISSCIINENLTLSQKVECIKTACQKSSEEFKLPPGFNATLQCVKKMENEETIAELKECSVKNNINAT